MAEKNRGKNAQKRLYRSQDNRVIAGVLGGIGEYLNVDPTAVRVLTVVLAVITGFFPLVLAYVLAWIVMPEAPA